MFSTICTALQFSHVKSRKIYKSVGLNYSADYQKCVLCHFRRYRCIRPSGYMVRDLFPLHRVSRFRFLTMEIVFITAHGCLQNHRRVAGLTRIFLCPVYCVIKKLSGYPAQQIWPTWNGSMEWKLHQFWLIYDRIKIVTQ